MEHNSTATGHHHADTRKQLTLIIVAAILLAAAIIVDKTCTLTIWQTLLVYLVPYLLIGHHTICEALEGLAHGEAFNEHFLMTIATAGALAIGFLPNGEPEFAEAVFVMLFFQVGELFEHYAEGQSRSSIAHLMNIRPDEANVERQGSVLSVKPEQVAVGETIIVRPGEKVPLDGIVVDGTSLLNTVALTGESYPRRVVAGDNIVSGCINMQGVLRIRTTRNFGQSTVSRIIDLVEHAAEHKSRSESFITRFARVYTPIVVFAAIAIALLPPLFSGNFAGEFTIWLNRALIFLIVSCPCALVISVPLTFFGGIGGASQQGILVKGANHLDILSKVSVVVFDKTGTLTHGQFAVTAVHPDKCDEHHLLHLAAHVEHYSTHPIGTALRDAFPEEATDGCQLNDVKEIAGQGICARVENDYVCVGNAKLMDAVGAQWHECTQTGTVIHVAINGEYAGHILINDKLKDDSRDAITQLKSLGVNKTVMLTGDHQHVAEDVARMLDIDDWHAELLPADKVQQIERLQAQYPEENIAFVGDGINDAPVLARADVGIAMGGLGSDAAIEAADIVLMDDQPTKIATAIRIARRTLSIARQNVWGAIGIKAGILLLAASGLAAMWMAVFADVGVTVLAVLNATRALHHP